MGVGVIRALLYGRSGRGAGELAVAAAALMAVTARAAWFQPTAASIDPMRVLREE